MDVFIPESVEDATVRVSQEMKKDIKTYEGVICWGNSNLNPDFYKDVLRTASKMKRVVRFVRWYAIVACHSLLSRCLIVVLSKGQGAAERAPEGVVPPQHSAVLPDGQIHRLIQDRQVPQVRRVLHDQGGSQQPSRLRHAGR